MGDGCARGLPGSSTDGHREGGAAGIIKGAIGNTEQETTGVAVDMSRPFINDHRVSDIANNKH